jgi:hypothetical protein
MSCQCNSCPPASSSSRDRFLFVCLGAALASAGFAIGSFSRPNAAVAQLPAGGAVIAGSASFGFAVPKDGYALVSDPIGNAWIIGQGGTATRVLYSISGNAPDKPRQTEEQLPLR